MCPQSDLAPVEHVGCLRHRTSDRIGCRQPRRDPHWIRAPQHLLDSRGRARARCRSYRLEHRTDEGGRDARSQGREALARRRRAPRSRRCAHDRAQRGCPRESTQHGDSGCGHHRRAPGALVRDRRRQSHARLGNDLRVLGCHHRASCRRHRLPRARNLDLERDRRHVHERRGRADSGRSAPRARVRDRRRLPRSRNRRVRGASGRARLSPGARPRDALRALGIYRVFPPARRSAPGRS